MKGRGKHPSGKDSLVSKLDREIAMKILALRKEKSAGQIAEMFGLKVELIRRVLRGEHWTVRVAPGETNA